MDYQQFRNEVLEIKSRLLTDFDLADALDHVDAEADSHQSVIYFNQSWDFVNMIRESDYSLYMEAHSELFNSFADQELYLNRAMSQMAFCIWYVAISQALYHKF